MTDEADASSELFRIAKLNGGITESCCCIRRDGSSFRVCFFWTDQHRSPAALVQT